MQSRPSSIGSFLLFVLLLGLGATQELLEVPGPREARGEGPAHCTGDSVLSHDTAHGIEAGTEQLSSGGAFDAGAGGTAAKAQTVEAVPDAGGSPKSDSATSATETRTCGSNCSASGPHLGPGGASEQPTGCRVGPGHNGCPPDGHPSPREEEKGEASPGIGVGVGQGTESGPVDREPLAPSPGHEQHSPGQEQQQAVEQDAKVHAATQAPELQAPSGEPLGRLEQHVEAGGSGQGANVRAGGVTIEGAAADAVVAPVAMSGVQEVVSRGLDAGSTHASVPEAQQQVQQQQQPEQRKRSSHTAIPKPEDFVLSMQPTPEQLAMVGAAAGLRGGDASGLGVGVVSGSGAGAGSPLGLGAGGLGAEELLGELLLSGGTVTAGGLAADGIGGASELSLTVGGALGHGAVGDGGSGAAAGAGAGASPAPSAAAAQPQAAAGPAGGAAAAGAPGAGSAAHGEDDEDEGRKINLASAADGASIVAANKEAKKPDRLIDGDDDSYMKNACSAPKWVIVELSQLGRVDEVKLTMKEMYSSRVKDFVVKGRQVHPKKDGLADYAKGLELDSWQLLGTFHAENKKGSQVFRLPRKARVRYLLLQVLSHYGSEEMCALNSLEVRGVTAAQELEAALARPLSHPPPPPPAAPVRQPVPQPQAAPGGTAGSAGPQGQAQQQQQQQHQVKVHGDAIPLPPVVVPAGVKQPPAGGSAGVGAGAGVGSEGAVHAQGGDRSEGAAVNKEQPHNDQGQGVTPAPPPPSKQPAKGPTASPGTAAAPPPSQLGEEVEAGASQSCGDPAGAGSAAEAGRACGAAVTPANAGKAAAASSPLEPGATSVPGQAGPAGVASQQDAATTPRDQVATAAEPGAHGGPAASGQQSTTPRGGQGASGEGVGPAGGGQGDELPCEGGSRDAGNGAGGQAAGAVQGAPAQGQGQGPGAAGQGGNSASPQTLLDATRATGDVTSAALTGAAAGRPVEGSVVTGSTGAAVGLQATAVRNASNGAGSAPATADARQAEPAGVEPANLGGANQGGTPAPGDVRAPAAYGGVRPAPTGPPVAPPSPSYPPAGRLAPDASTPTPQHPTGAYGAPEPATPAPDSAPQPHAPPPRLNTTLPPTPLEAAASDIWSGHDAASPMPTTATAPPSAVAGLDGISSTAAPAGSGGVGGSLAAAAAAAVGGGLGSGLGAGGGPGLGMSLEGMLALLEGASKPRVAGNLFDVIKQEMMMLKLNQTRLWAYIAALVGALDARHGEQELDTQALEDRVAQLDAAVAAVRQQAAQLAAQSQAAAVAALTDRVRRLEAAEARLEALGTAVLMYGGVVLALAAAVAMGGGRYRLLRVVVVLLAVCNAGVAVALNAGAVRGMLVGYGAAARGAAVRGAAWVVQEVRRGAGGEGLSWMDVA